MLLGQKSFLKSLEMGNKASICMGKGNPPTAIPAVENVGWKRINCGEINPKSFSELVFFHRGSLIWPVATQDTLGGIHLSAEGQNKLYILKRALKRNGSADVLPSAEGHLSGLKSSMNVSWQIAPATQKTMGWTKSCSSAGQSQILALVGMHPYLWQAWELAGNAGEGIAASWVHQTFISPCKEKLHFYGLCAGGCQEGCEMIS